MKVVEMDYDVKKGSVILVKANVFHKFHSIRQELMLLVLFAPPEDRRSQESFERKYLPDSLLN